MARRLSPDEQALWLRVAESIRPLPGRIRPAPLPAPAKPAHALRDPVVSVPIAPPRPLAPSRPPRPTAAAATLDGSWDKRLRTGDVRPDRVVDLHGHNLATAHALLATTLDQAIAAGDRIVLIVTGKGRIDRPARIRAELAHWIDTGGHRRHVAALRPAHPRHGGGGAFYLILRR